MDFLGIIAYVKNTYFKLHKWMNTKVSDYTRKDGVQDVIVYILCFVLTVKLIIQG